MCSVQSAAVAAWRDRTKGYRTKLTVAERLDEVSVVCGNCGRELNEAKNA